MRMILFFFSVVLFQLHLQSAEPTCKMCEVIREQNKHKVNKYKYYEDYLQDQQNYPQEQESNQKIHSGDGKAIDRSEARRRD